MNFLNYYTLLEQNDIESLEEKVYASNILKGLAQRLGFNINKIKVDPNTKEYELTGLSQSGFNRLTTQLGQGLINYKDKKSKQNKAQVVAVYEGIVDTTNGFPDNFPQDPQKITSTIYGIMPTQNAFQKFMTFGMSKNVDQIKAQGSLIVLYEVIDEGGKPSYYVGVSGKGQQYFKDFFGMPLNTFIASNRPGTPGEGIESERGAQQKKTVEPEYTVIDKETFLKLIPAFAESEDITEASKPEYLKVYKDENGNFYRWTSSSKMDQFYVDTYKELMDKIKERSKGQSFIVVDKDGKQDKKAGADLVNKMKNSPNEKIIPFGTEEPKEPTPEVKQDTSSNDDEDVTDHIVGTTKPEPKEEPAPANEPTAAPSKQVTNDIGGKGTIFNKIKRDINGKPKPLTPTNIVAQGWMYILKQGGQFFAYLTKNGEYKLAYDKGGKNYLLKKNIIQSQVVQPALT